MEQYWMPKKLDFFHLKRCLEWHIPESLYIRDIGSHGGKVHINENLEGRSLDFKTDKGGLTFLIDSTEVFSFPLQSYQKGFSLAYERIQPTTNGIGRPVILSTGIEPYDVELPEPRKSVLRNVLDEKLLEITFRGRIPLRFHSWFEKPNWKYWTTDNYAAREYSLHLQQLEYDANG